ncbi:sulfatase-like hydrolase/transferase [Prosthecobacter sp. SYSU 5D2]|uniref:sulfatase-like hydrolase/transferase n=1 Tax=Prosthecobacter sp. SYSU 5D2 TaxID=3134134 RepID=UPI0031FEADCC
MNLRLEKQDAMSSAGRRDFLKMVGGTGAMIAAQGAVNFWPNETQAQAIKQRRNVILFTTDQQQNLRWFPEGWQEANLPGLNRLKNTGVTFTRAYTNTAMCTPSRTTMFTGLYPEQHRNFDTLSEGMSQSEAEHQLDPTLPNIATVLGSAGYDVVWKGKWHLSKGMEHPDGGHQDDDISRYGMQQWNSPDAGGDAKLKNYGGGTINNDGRYFDGSTWQEPTGDPSDPGYIFSQAEGPMNAEFERESVMAFLRHKINNPGGNPFCLIICLINPHDVLGCPGVSVANGGNGTYLEGGYYGREDGSSPWSEQTGPLEIGLPPTYNESLLENHKPVCQPNFLAFSAGLGPVPTDDLKLKYLNFYGNLMKLNDQRLTKMLDLIEGLDGTVDAGAAQALRRDSWIIFTSDHGDMAMAHGGLRQKSFEFYEEMANVPLVWSNPVDFPEGRVCDELVSHVDFMPTLSAVAGLNPRAFPFKGVDYSSLLRNPDGKAVQDAILFTFDDIWCGQDAAGNPNGLVAAPNRLRALVEKDFKYVYYFDGEGSEKPQDEFYDLRSKGDGGTDTDMDNGLGGSTGKAAEYINYSVWAERQRVVKLATGEIAAKRKMMQAKLQRVMKAKLAPLRARPAVPPQDFRVELFNWVNDYQQLESELLITWLSRSTSQYQLQYSRDQKNWTNVGAPVPGTNGPIFINQPVTGFKVYYRLTWAPKRRTKTPQPASTTKI